MTAPRGRPLVAVLVGTDHHPFQRLVTWASTLASEGWADWFVQHGSAQWPETDQSGAQGARVVDQPTLRDLLERAQCVVCHAGPGLLMDAASAGHRPIVVARDPTKGEHVDGHQIDFAQRMARADRIETAGDLGTLRSQVRATLQRPSSSSVSGLESASTCDRFGSLVAAAVSSRRPALMR